jgi:pyruvate formate lyase activating enzyme
MTQAVLFKKQGNNIKCLACAHKCVIAEGKTGICGVRKNIKGKINLLVYGRVIAKHIDPIEKKPLYNFLPGSKTFSIGTLGCNFKCDFCQNFDISQAKTLYGEKIIGEEITPKQIVDQAIDSGCKSISYTYNEPATFIEFVRDIAELAKKSGLKNILVTNGYLSKESFDFIKDYIDAMNIDLKSFNEDFYKKLCGASLQPVLDTIKRVHDAKIHLELTTLVIHEENDSSVEFEKIAKFIAKIDKNIPWHISRFFPMYKMQHKPVTPLATLERAEAIGRRYLKYVYIGNI